MKSNKKPVLFLLIGLLLLLTFYKLALGVSLLIYVPAITIFLVLIFVLIKLVFPQKWVQYFSLLLVFTVLVAFPAKGIFVAKNETPPSSSNKSIKPSTAECSANALKYDKKVLKITGENIKGTVYLKANTKECRIEATFILLLNTSLPVHQVSDLPYLYNYVGLLLADGKRNDVRGTGYLTPTYKNQTSLPTPGLSSQEVSSYYLVSGVPSNITETQYFYANFERWEELSEGGYKKLFYYNQYGVIDSVAYQKKETLNGGGFTYSTDLQKAEKEGVIYKSFSFTISE